MYSLQDENIHNLSVKGVFDDCQDIVKALAGDLEFKSKWHLGAVNSINWARISAQVVYYFWGWLRSTSQAGQKVSFAVPSGNFGNILSGHIARQMGLPIAKLVLATNENNVLEEFFRTGIYRPRGSGFVAGASSHQDRLNTIAQVNKQYQTLIDPHTADAVKVAQNFREEGIPMLVLETALPAKFSETIEEAIGQPAPVPAHLTGLADLPQKVVVMDSDVAQVRRYIEEHAPT